MTNARSATYRSNAKVNPILRVLGRRADGMHELESLMLGLGLGGVVTVSVTPGGESGALTVETAGRERTPDIVDGPEHLALRGAQAAREAAGMGAVPLHVVCEKGVPSRAGLGGGSADAAAAARATLDVLVGSEVSDVSAELEADVLGRLGEIGADCAFFFGARGHSAALARGRGELLEPLVTTPAWHVAVITPSVVCSTPAVYGAMGMDGAPMRETELDAADCERLLQMPASEARELLVNDLEGAALRAEPGLAAWLDMIDEVGASHLCLAGSGSSLFGLFDDQEDAVACVRQVLDAATGRGLVARFACVTAPEADLTQRESEGADV